MASKINTQQRKKFSKRESRLVIPIGFRKPALVHFTTSPDQPAKIQRHGEVKKGISATHIAILERVTEVSGRRNFGDTGFGHSTDECHPVRTSIKPI